MPRYFAYFLSFKFKSLTYRPSILTDVAIQCFMISVSIGYAISLNFPDVPLFLVMIFVMAGMGTTLALLYIGLKREIRMAFDLK